MTSNYWEQFEAEDTTPTGDYWEQFEAEEPLTKKVPRLQAQFSSRLGESIAGAPGDIFNLIPDYLKGPIGKKLGKHLPTSKSLRETSKKLTKGYTEPKKEWEEKIGEIYGDVGSSLLSPIKGGVPKTLARVVGVPLLGALTKEGITRAGGKKTTAEGAKLATMLAADLMMAKSGNMPGGVKKYGERLLGEAEKAIPKNSIAQAPEFARDLRNLRTELEGGLSGPHVNDTIRAIKKIQKRMPKGNIDPKDFPALRKELNTLIENMQGFSLEGPPKKIRQKAVRNLNKLKGKLIEAGTQWGEKNAPEFAKKWREGNEVLAVNAKSKAISNWVSDKLTIKNPLLRTLYGVHTYHHPVKGAAIGAGKKAVDLATRFPAGVLYRFFKSPTLRKKYANTLRDILAGNASKAQKTINRMEKEMSAPEWWEEE